MKITKIEDYIDQVYEKYPYLEKKEMLRLLQFGMRSYYIHNLYGADVLIKTKHSTIYTGKFFDNNLVFYHYWRIKNKIKLRILYKRRHIQWDGKYYFGLTEREYQEWNKQVKPNSRKYKYTYTNVYGYKIKEECFLDRSKKYLFEMTYPLDMGFQYTWRELTTRAKMIGKRNENNEIEFI